MKHKTAELEGELLDAAVAKAEGRMPDHGWSSPLGPKTDAPMPGQFECFSSDWADGGPIIERERITIIWARENGWLGRCKSHWQVPEELGPTPLIAAMRAYIASRFGDEVELP